MSRTRVVTMLLAVLITLGAVRISLPYAVAWYINDTLSQPGKNENWLSIADQLFPLKVIFLTQKRKRGMPSLLS